jgi:hypothetical protein
MACSMKTSDCEHFASPSSKRHLLHFSLGALLVAFTAVAACMLMWNVQIVRERRAALAEWAERLDSGGFNEGWVKGQNIDLGPGNELSWIRTWLNDSPLYCLQFQDDTHQSVLETAAALFPEAKLISRRSDPWDEKVVRDTKPAHPFITERSAED